MKEKTKNHLISLSVLLAFLPGLIFGPTLFQYTTLSEILETSILIFFISFLLTYPIILSILNLFFLFVKPSNKQLARKGKQIEIITVILGFILSAFLLTNRLTYITPYNWTETLTNSQLHTPIWTGGMVTVSVLSLIGVIGYLCLLCTRIQKVPPLITVTAIAAMYLGMTMCLLWLIQIFTLDNISDIFSFLHLYLCLFPLNCIILGIKLIRCKVLEWEMNEPEETKQFQNIFLNRLNQEFSDSATWPLAAFLLVWPLLGIVICILLIFGQSPDSVIRAWTETSDWNLSTKISPPNVHYDEHYLCTVAAGGHRRIVKPVRMGERHGHRVVVNRQLCIANAFEQILEERIPVIHRHIRHFYDTYGFPLARMIHTPYAADIIYLAMKPLEWIFLIVLYFSDVNPENRIAMQYLPDRIKSEISSQNKIQSKNK